MPDSHLSRRDFIKATTFFVGGAITFVLGLPAIAYLIDPALHSTGKETWVPIGKLDQIPVGVPFPFSFTQVQVNGWERTSTSHGGFVVRKSDNPKDLIILNSRCTHLGCTVNWKSEANAFVCPCHDAKFDANGKVLAGPPPRPLDRYTNTRVADDGTLEILFAES
ncbi:MAG TPA: ubiquinol-cytochrome c reductase iron-sulfur subunit [Anaerolineales bacterium]|nr:ubiquinol-cytochrome c reductase iron-sulfur subunit [Anaerolineales bacterium]